MPVACLKSFFLSSLLWFLGEILYIGYLADDRVMSYLFMVLRELLMIDDGSFIFS